MKKLGSFLFSMLIGILMVQAQLPLNITGDVVNGATGVPYHNVNLLIYSGGFFSYTDSVLTDSAGYFSFTPVMPPGITQGTIEVTTFDCNNNLLLDSAGFWPMGTTANFLFNYCGSGAGCGNNFTYQTSPANGVSFFASTTGAAPFTYVWDFGDGMTSTLANPFHTYNALGTYNVCLITTDNLGCVDTTCKFVSLNSFPACSAVFTYFGSGITNQFQFISDTTLNQTAVLTWDFGDGNTSQSLFPTHTYSSPGTYIVCLTTVDTSFACVDSFCATITIGSGNCQAGFTTTNIQGNTWSFSNTSTGGALSYTWVFGDGTSSTLQNPIHSFTNAGTYNVCLVINDNLGCIDSTCAIITVGSGSNCNAYFTSFGSGTTLFSFQADSSLNSPFATYSWDFGDNNSGNGSYVTHNYNTGGLYTVCLTVNDSINNCTSTYCDSIVVGSAPGCQAGFNITANQGSLNVLFTNTSIGGSIINPLTYQWDFGDGSFSTQQNPSHTYASSGTYTVCLVILDNMNCNDTLCVPITIVGNGNNCTALYTISNTGTGAFTFLADSTGNNVGTNYSWDFGDNSFGNGLLVTHTYNSSGLYLACLTVYDSLTNCTATFCDTIVIQTPGTYNITGNVFADSNLVYNGFAYLIVHDTINGTLTAIDSVPILQSYYSFSNVNPGSYLVKAALTPTSPNYANYLPTYLGDVLFWNSATSTIVTNSNISLPNIYLVPGVNTGGPGFIGGLISQGANKGPGDPLSDVLVLIMDINDNPVAYTFTDANGEYEFANLAYGTYKIYVEIAGKYSDYWTVTISGDNQMYENADFEVGETQINTVGTSIDKFTFGEILGIYPNPARDLIQVQVEFTEPSELSIELLNMVGQTIDRQDPGMVLGNQSFQFQLSNLPQGTYLIKLQSDNQVITKRIIKQN